MHVRDLPLSPDVRDHFVGRGIEELYPPQAAAVEAGVADGANVLAAIPTASGKTFLAQVAILTADGPGLYIVPLRALAREKYHEFDALPGVDVAISTGDYDASDDLGDYDVVVATSEKVDAALRNGASWVDDLACVAVDEVHLLGASGRGPTLEVTLATIRRRIPDVQVVALSATIANPGEVAAWLDADLVESRWRPVDLRTGVYADGRVDFDDGTDLTVDVAADADDTDATVALVCDALDGGGQCLAFVRSRREAESLAERLAEADVGAAPAVADEVLAAGEASMGRRLADCLRGGVAFHHAGLRSNHREAVESAFRDRDLAVICATPTLAAGVNVPARRVIVRDQERYTGSGTEWLPVLEVHQMCGRAGRPHLDPYGEAVLVADGDAAELHERYVDADPEAVESQLADPAALRTHVLALVAAGFADTRDRILGLLDETFYAHQRPDGDRSGILDDALDELAGMEMLTDEGGPAATPLGETVSRQYVRPETGAAVVDGVRAAARRRPEDVTELTALEIVCDTPDMQDTYLGNRERADMYQFARDHAAEFTTAMAEADDFEGWLTAVKTARVLHEWSEGRSVEALVEDYRIGPGDLESRIERGEWLLRAAGAIVETMGVEGAVPPFDGVREALQSRS
jgi:helicase